MGNWSARRIGSWDCSVADQEFLWLLVSYALSKGASGEERRGYVLSTLPPRPANPLGPLETLAHFHF
jgi:hypothetical protein